MLNNPKILHIINSLQVGGAESLLTQFLLDAKRRTKNSLDIAVLYGNNVYANSLRNSGINVIEINMKRKYGIHVIREIANIIKDGNYKIVMAQLFPTTLYVALASFLLPDIKFILRETSIYNRRRKYRFLKILDTFIYAKYSKIICVNRKVEEELIKWIPSVKGKTRVVYKGIPIPRFKKTSCPKYDIIFVGRLIQAKGVDVLLEALAKLRNRETLKKVIIVGDGPLRNSLERKANKLGISKCVSFLGKRNDILDLLRMSKFFVLPSRWEGTPSALLEAMAVGLPSISTKVGGIPEIINNGTTGILVPPQDSVSLANALELLLSDERLAHTLGINARRKVEQEYSIQHYSNKLLGLYQELLASP